MCVCKRACVHEFSYWIPFYLHFALCLMRDRHCLSSVFQLCWSSFVCVLFNSVEYVVKKLCFCSSVSFTSFMFFWYIHIEVCQDGYIYLYVCMTSPGWGRVHGWDDLVKFYGYYIHNNLIYLSSSLFCLFFTVSTQMGAFVEMYLYSSCVPCIQIWIVT